MKLILAGATGLVGGECLQLAERASDEVVTIGRRSLQRGENEILADFTAPIDLPHADAVICTLGTTLARAGSREAFYAVDHDAVLTLARSARSSGIDHFLVITAVGADPRSRVFYSRVKGEIERDLEELKFARLDIARPGLLLGNRDETRPVEALFQRLDPLIRPLLFGPLDRYGSIEAGAVARALLALAREATPGRYVHGNEGLRTAAQRSPELP